MKKEEIRKEFFKLRNKGHSYSQCRRLLKAIYSFEASVRTFKRWNARLNSNEWDFRDGSRKPKVIHYKITPELEKEVVDLRNKTGWGAEKIKSFVQEISESSIKRIILKNKLNAYSRPRKKRIKYVRWQRKHPNSLWQVDHSDQKIKDKWCLSILDDCSRYSLALTSLNIVTTESVTKVLDDLIKVHGKPREILTDNGSAYGLTSKHSKFDRWCRRRGIKHIRTAIHSPTTTGKVERLFQTLKNEMKFCKDDAERFRMRYNHFRPHTSLGRKPPAQIYFAFEKLF